MSENLDEDGFTVDQQQHAEKRAAAEAAASPDQYIDALLVEREGYARFGRDDRVAAVDEQLALRGHKVAAESRAKAAPQGVKGRAAAPADHA